MGNNNINIQSGERLSFYKLFAEEDYQVEIPIIQRDYAQGRASKSVVRETFLEALYQYLDENKPNRDLDFVYGSVNTSTDGIQKFIPLDGQQRLTTLFLLHWYLANLAGEQDEFRKIIAIEKDESFKSKFTYETRTSSGEFCDELITHDLGFNDLLPPDEDIQNQISKTIKDKGWYYLAWQNDPTIQSMLIMLDAIHAKFQDNPEYYSRLTNTDKPVITFQFLNLDEFSLTDDLYIKMNARGKPLTTFENFKARLEQYIDGLKWDKKENRTLKSEVVNRSVHPREYFAVKIDTTWANLFWQYRNTNGKDNAFDDELMNFIRVVLANEYSSSTTKPEKNPNLEFITGTSVAQKRKDYTDDISFHQFQKLGVLSKDAIDYLINALDILSNGDQKIKKHLSEPFYYNEETIFQSVLKHDLSLPERVQFHAYLKYLISGKDIDDLHDWMRVVHNLTENTRIDGAEEVSRAIKSIDKLISFKQDIITYLKSSGSKIEFFSAWQIKEEKIKAHLLEKPDDWRLAIEKAEIHPYFKGQIGFLLEYSGIMKYYEENNNCSWKPANDQNYLAKYTDYSKKSRTVFSIINDKEGSRKINYLWERAVLSKGDYFIEASANRKNMLCTSRNLRDFSWKRLLRWQGPSDKDANKWIKRRQLVKEVFDDKNFNSNSLSNSLKEIIARVPVDWRKYFIESPSIIEYSQQGFIRYNSEYDIKVFSQSQQNHYHRELRTYSLVLNEFRNESIFKPFTEIWHKGVKSSEDNSCAVFRGLQYRNKEYSIEIYFNNENEFEIRFFTTHAPNVKKSYSKKIKPIIESLQFDWYDDEVDYEGYWNSVDTKSDVRKLVKKLCHKLNNI